MNNLIVIPTYNEAENVINLINSLQVVNCDILIVDDSSPDKTSDLVRGHIKFQKSVYLIERTGERGYASACKAGFEYGIQKNYQSLIQMDADFSHSTEDLKDMLSFSTDYDLIIGSRYIVGGKTSGWGIGRILLSKIANLFTKGYLRIKVNDLTSGFRIYKTEVIKSIDLKSLSSEGYGFLVEILYELNKNKISIKEVPIHFNDRKFGSSKMNTSIILEAIRLVILLKFKS